MKVVHIVALSIVAVGLAIGSAILGTALADPTDSSEYASLSDERDDLAAERDDLARQAAEANAGREEAESALSEAVADLPDREAAVEAAEKDIKKRLGALQKSESAVAKREKAVGIVERTIKNNTIPGDGVYRVGTDMKPGTYRSVGNSDCYYQVSSDPNGDNIITNHIGSGPILVSVSAGTYFQTQMCRDWVLQP